MAVDACFANVFCNLGDAVVQSVNASLVAAQAAIQTEIISLTALIAASGLELLPLQVVAAAAQEVVTAAQGITNLIPVEEAGGCLPVGELVQGVTVFLADQQAAAEQSLAAANRWLARQTELEERRAALQALDARLTELRLAFPAPC